MATQERIKGSVARVLSTRELVINRGSADGVELEMKFSILDPNGLDITDPETGTVLGSVHRPKTQVVVTQVEPHLSVAMTFKYTETNVGGTGLADLSAMGAVSKLFEPPKFVRQYETFRTEDAPWDEINESQSYVKPGDPVEQVVVIEGEPIDSTRRRLERSAGTSVRPSTSAGANVVPAPQASSEGGSS